MMTDPKSLLRHEVLNLLTILMHLLGENEPMTGEDKKNARELIELSSLLIGHESLFLNIQPKLFVQPVDLTEHLELLRTLYEEEIKKKNIQVVLPEALLMVQSDRYYLTEAVHMLFKVLLNTCSRIVIKAEKREGRIRIEHDGGNIIPFPRSQLIEQLKKKKTDLQEMRLQLALKFFETLSLRISSENKLILLDEVPLTTNG